MNQTKHCWQNYVDYHKCINAKGEDFAPCRQFFLAYRSLCPSGWYQRWDDQRGSYTNIYIYETPASLQN
jgi:cytochrome c oxidase subunit 6b